MPSFVHHTGFKREAPKHKSKALKMLQMHWNQWYWTIHQPHWPNCPQWQDSMPFKITLKLFDMIIKAKVFTELHPLISVIALLCLSPVFLVNFSVRSLLPILITINLKFGRSRWVALLGIDGAGGSGRIFSDIAVMPPSKLLEKTMALVVQWWSVLSRCS